jgi:L-threonylcarbamoyladenylate synthase
METVLTRDTERAAAFIKLGGVVAFPTETVYGLGANVFDAAAVAKIFEAKQRPADNPLIAHISAIDQLQLLTTEVPQYARQFMDAFFPGPLTLVLPKSKAIPLIATAGLETIGVRMPRFEIAREFVAACGVPIVAPSANLSGRPSPTTWQAVYEDLNERIDCILKGEPTEIGLESTVVDCSGEAPVLLRTGAISLEDLRNVAPETRPYETPDLETPKSPGLKHVHYSPSAKVVVADDIAATHDLSEAAYIGLTEPANPFEFTRLCSTVDEYAHSLFEFFRECDRRGIETIYCEAVDETGIGAALMDRIRRAAAK